ncbi:MAG: hypothetical protein P8M12_07580 [Flavobacteriales bacterium]|jgi:hypothetical protein|nr:hypothetical protein [Flavobacteriales bacterium]
MSNLIKALIITLFVLPLSNFAQDCNNIVRYCPHSKKEGFVFNMQSESGAFVQGDTSEVSIIVYKGMEYKISLCSPSHPQLNGTFQFKIVEHITRGEWEEKTTYTTEVEYDDYGLEIGEKQIPSTTKKRVYTTEEIIRYDNSADENAQEFTFQSNKTRKLYIKVFVPEMGGEQEMGLEGESYSCVGLLIEHQSGVKTGFKR